MKLGSSVIQDKKKVNTKQENGKEKKKKVHFPWSEAVWGGMIKDSSSLSVPHKPLQERLNAPRDYFDH